MAVIKKRIVAIKKALVEKEEEPKFDYTRVLSTGTLLLDLAISGTVIRGGGIPGGCLVEIFGPPAWGKTTLLGEICASAQRNGGFAMVGDAERRMTPIWIKRMGIKVTEKNLRYPHTVDDLEELIFETPETGGGVIDVVGVDSTAVLVSSAETIKSDDGEVTGTKKDKRGSAKAKDLHSLTRRAKGILAKKNRIVVFTNQIQDVQTEPGQMNFGPKEKTPGGNAVPFMASLRLRVGPARDSKIKKKVKIGQREIEQSIGIRTNVFVFKSSLDTPYREAEVCTIFDYGIDDIRANLEYIKRMSGSKKYWAYDEEFQFLDPAIKHIEDNNLEPYLREATIDLWEEIQKNFRNERKEKDRR
jgi:recombination protein RecA